MKVRIISAMVGLLILVPILWFSDTVLFPIALALCAAVAAYEIVSCVGSRFWYVLAPSMTFAALGPLMTEWISSNVKSYIAFLAMMAFAYLFLLFGAAVLSGGKLNYSTVAETVIGVVYATVGFTSIALLRRLAGGQYLFGMVFVGAWVTDTMAYFTGRFFGKHKLCPNISPKKTVEGSLGGIIFCALSFLLYGFIVQKIVGVVPNYPMLFISGIASSVVSQIGDLAASLIKREHDVKDYGKLMPGHGGVMDRFDSILALAPMLLVLCGFASAFAFFY
ncbi:MAG: phosphatidate cytidylyltransferase [Ruminococcaceae bacterium]|nr:phosphatidate cytidylyltransferase [Oscillospiraceae bacterium]